MKSRKLLFKIFIISIGILGISSAVVAMLQQSVEIKNVDESNRAVNQMRYNALVNQETGVIDPADVAVAYSQARSMQKAAQDNPTIDWSFAGPDNVGGRINATLWDVKESGETFIYAGAAAGGIYRSADNGSSWDKINLENANLKISSFIHGADGIYAGTGVKYLFPGTGLYKSTDGENFDKVAGADWPYINAIAVNNYGMYVATMSGLYYRADGTDDFVLAKTADFTLEGEAFDVQAQENGGFVIAVMGGKVYTSANGDFDAFKDVSTQEVQADTTLNPDKLPFEDISSAAVAIAPSDASIIYASLVDMEEGACAGVYKSDDTGETWRLILPMTTTVNPLMYVGDVTNTLVVYPDDANRVLIGGYSLWEGYMYNEVGYYDFGLSPKAAPFYLEGVNYLTSPNYVHALIYDISFHPTNSQTFIMSTAGGCYYTDNAANELIYNINKGLNVTNITSLSYDAEAPCGNKLVGTQGNGLQYIAASSSNISGYDIFTQGVVNSGSAGDCAVSTINNEFIIYSSGYNFQRSEDLGFSSANYFFTDVMSDPFSVPRLGMWESFNCTTSKDSVTYVLNPTFYPEKLIAGDTIYCKSNNYIYPFMHVLEQDLEPGDSVVVQDIVQNKCFAVMATDVADFDVYLSNNVLDFTVAPTWWKIGMLDATPTCLAYSSDGDILYVGTESGNVYQFANILYAYNEETADMYSSYQVISKNLVASFENRAIISIAVDPSNNDNAMVTLGGFGNDHFVYKTTNALDAEPVFEAIDAGLPAAPVYSALYYQTDKYPEANIIFVGSEVGLYISEDGGSTWAFAQSDMKIVPVFILSQQISDRQGQYIEEIDAGTNTLMTKYYPGVANYMDIYCATSGRGLYRNEYETTSVDPIAPNNSKKGASINVYPNPVVSSATIEAELSTEGAVQVDIYNIRGQLMSSTNLGHQSKGVFNYTFDCTQLEQGAYIVHFVEAGQTSVGKFVKLK